MLRKFVFGGVHLGGSPEGWYPQIMSKYLSLKYLLISKKTGTLALAVQKIDFLGPHFGEVPGGVAPKKISGDTIAYVPQQLHTKIRFLCFVV